MARALKSNLCQYVGLTAATAWLALSIPAAFAGRRPAWISDPKSEDSIYIYSLGHAHGQPTAEAAEREAFRDALLRILRAHRSDIEDPDRWPMQNASIVGGGIYHEEIGGRHACWVQVMWPKSERANLVEQITAADRVEEQWRQARTLVADGQPAEGRQQLFQLLKTVGDAPATEHLLPDVQYQIARAWHADNRPLEARRWYERLIHQAPDDPLAGRAAEHIEQLPPPPRFWPMNARFAGGPIGLLAVISDGGDWRPFRELTGVLAQESRAAGLESVDLAAGRSANELMDAVENAGKNLLPSAGAAADLTAMLLVAVEIDPSKRGATTTAFGAEIPVRDTRTRIHVLDASRGDTLYEDSFPALAGSRSPSNLAEYISNILVERHLLPHCPGLKRLEPEVVDVNARLLHSADEP